MTPLGCFAARSRTAEIAELAAGLVNVQNGSAVDPVTLAEDHGLEVTFVPFLEEIDGLLFRATGRTFLVCNSRRCPRGSPRARFTVAHELGHYFLHRAQLESGELVARFPRCDPAIRPLEQDCDLFAACLLMPAEVFRNEAAKITGTGALRIVALAAIFGVSVTSAAYRAMELDLFPAPAAVLVWNSRGKPGGRRYSATTKLMGRNYRGLAENPPSESVTTKTLAKLAIGHREGTAPISDWFPALYGSSADSEDMLHEEVKSLGHHGWLTLIYKADRAIAESECLPR